MKLSERLSSAREKFGAIFIYDKARELYRRTLHLREMPDGRCQVIRYVSKEEWEKPEVRVKYEAGALVLADAKNWKELGI